jgi:deazaflavin-dependent oxidoreductase (nitroreductase family)
MGLGRRDACQAAAAVAECTAHGSPLELENQMESRICDALDRDRVIDITTTGCNSGAPRRIEIWFFRTGGRIYLTGAPGRRRSWYRNLAANPAFTFHLKQSTQADLDATAHPIVGDEAREPILRALIAQLEPGIPAEWMPGMSEAARAATDESFEAISSDPEAVLPTWLAESPLVEVRLSGRSAPS